MICAYDSQMIPTKLSSDGHLYFITSIQNFLENRWLNCWRISHSEMPTLSSLKQCQQSPLFCTAATQMCKTSQDLFTHQQFSAHVGISRVCWPNKNFIFLSCCFLTYNIFVHTHQLMVGLRDFNASKCNGRLTITNPLM